MNTKRITATTIKSSGLTSTVTQSKYTHLGCYVQTSIEIDRDGQPVSNDVHIVLSTD